MPFTVFTPFLLSPLPPLFLVVSKRIVGCKIPSVKICNMKIASGRTKYVRAEIGQEHERIVLFVYRVF